MNMNKKNCFVMVMMACIMIGCGANTDMTVCNNSNVDGGMNSNNNNSCFENQEFTFSVYEEKDNRFISNEHNGIHFQTGPSTDLIPSLEIVYLNDMNDINISGIKVDLVSSTIDETPIVFNNLEDIGLNLHNLDQVYPESYFTTEIQSGVWYNNDLNNHTGFFKLYHSFNEISTIFIDLNQTGFFRTKELIEEKLVITMNYCVIGN